MKNKCWLVVAGTILVLLIVLGNAVYMTSALDLFGQELLLNQKTVGGLLQFLVRLEVAITVFQSNLTFFVMLLIAITLDLWWILWLIGDRPEY
jgi:hypothetical protein